MTQPAGLASLKHGTGMVLNGRVQLGSIWLKTSWLPAFSDLALLFIYRIYTHGYLGYTLVTKVKQLYMSVLKQILYISKIVQSPEKYLHLLISYRKLIFLYFCIIIKGLISRADGRKGECVELSRQYFTRKYTNIQIILTSEIL